MARCEKCIHERACDSWKRHGEILYNDFSYNVEDCPFFSNRDAGKYIKLEDLQKFPIRRDHCDKERGSEHFINGIETVFEYAEYLPTYDVVPKSEVERLEEELSKANAEVKNYMKVAEYQQSLSVKRYHEIKRLKEDIDRLKYNLKAVLEEIPETKAEVAREIFAEIDKSYCVNKHGEVVVHFDAISEIKNKYKGGCDD